MILYVRRVEERIFEPQTWVTICVCVCVDDVWFNLNHPLQIRGKVVRHIISPRPLRQSGSHYLGSPQRIAVEADLDL